MSDQSIPEVEGTPLSDAYLTDRSRIILGRAVCKRARYREYHSGPTGYGIRRKASSLPLATGNQVHRVMEQLVRQWGQSPTDAAVRNLIKNEADRYRRQVAAKGILELPDLTDEGRGELKRVVDEQSALIEAMGWALHRVWLPELFVDFDATPVLIEEELTLPLGSGKVLMNRPDYVLRRKIDGALAQFEGKTVGGWLNLPSWRKQWPESPQLMLTKSCVERRLQHPVSFAYVWAMDKGKRSEEKATGQLKQWTHFLYAYHREANPPMWGEDWQLHYEWQGEDGKGHRLGKGYTRVSTFSFLFGGLPEGVTPTEFWMRAIDESEIKAMREVLGPFDFEAHQQESMLRGVAADEERWLQRLGAIYEAGERLGWEEGRPEFQETLDREAPQSWNCHIYGKDCQFLPICKKEPGWDAPHEDPRFELRRPHHQPELAQMTARGIEPPPDQDEEEGGPE